MVFDHILGQAPAIEILRRALAGDRVHHAYRFEGPSGVGKEMAAFALAQSLVCTEEGSVGCGTCRACHRAVTLADEEPHVPLHPDVIVVGRGVYPKSLLGTKESTGISVDQIRKVVLGRAGYTPHEARHLVFIVRDAEELTISAANALLKTLEEPSPQVHFVLLTSSPHRLVDTIRSRSLAVRFAPLADGVLETILERHGCSSEWVALAQGSAEAALELSDPDKRQQLQEFADELRAALGARDIVAALEAASKLPSDRHVLRLRLAAFSQLLAIEGRDAARNNPALAELRAEQYAVVQQAMKALERNASPTLAVEAMLVALRRRATPSGGANAVV